MTTLAHASDILNKEYLEIRARILELAAVLDRLDRAEGSVVADRRLTLIQQGLEILREPKAGRAEQVQLNFSLDYDPRWREVLPQHPRS